MNAYGVSKSSGNINPILIILIMSIGLALFPTSKVVPQNQYGKLPMYFTPNAGQIKKDVKYYSSGSGYSFFFTNNGVTYSFAKAGSKTLKINFIGANADANIIGNEKQDAKVNYLKGSNPKNWQTNVPTYSGITYQGIYPGIDIAYKGTNQQLKYEFYLKPGADYKQINLAYQGANSLSLDKGGNLLIKTNWGTLKDTKPYTYQIVNGKKTVIQSNYAVNGNKASFNLGKYNSSYPVVIDPSLTFSTFLGNSSSDAALDIAVDGIGNTYITGYNKDASNRNDVFVAKLNPAGSGLVYSTYFGGGSDDSGNEIAIDSSGNAYITGYTNSSNFPVTLNSYDKTYGGNTDAFIAKLNSTGSALVYSTYLGGSGNDISDSIVIDSYGNAYVTGGTDTGFPTTAGAYDTTANGNSDAFVAKINSTGSALVYSTYLGGSGNDNGNSIVVDSLGNTYVTGLADFGFPVISHDKSYNGGLSDAFLTKLNSAGSALSISSYLGGTYEDYANALFMDKDNNLYITGVTKSSDFFVTANANDPTYNGGYDVFLTRVDLKNFSNIYSSFFGGNTDDHSYDVAVDDNNNVYMTGITYSLDFPVTSNAYDASFNGRFDSFVTKQFYNQSTMQLVSSTFLGGGDYDTSLSIAVSSGYVYTGGWTTSSNFPTTLGTFDPSFNSPPDAFIPNPDAFVSKLLI